LVNTYFGLAKIALTLKKITPYKKMSIHPTVKRTPNKFIQDSRRVITRLYLPKGDNRIRRVIRMVVDLPEEQASEVFKNVLKEFAGRHKNVQEVFDRNFTEVGKFIPPDIKLTPIKKGLIGAYFTHEYSIQSAAFFNPSIVPHPDQRKIKKGSLRFILSFRSTGEGHISSVEFRSGVLRASHEITFDPVSQFVETPEINKNPGYDKHTFLMKLNEMQTSNGISQEIFDYLADQFTYEDLQGAIRSSLKVEHLTHHSFRQTIDKILWLAQSNCELTFHSGQDLSERVIFPVTQNDSKGIEDARFVKFIDDDGSSSYYATYTAYNGLSILPQLLETKDFLNFKMITLNGNAVKDKGMALFPQKIDGKYMMISRVDGEKMYIMSTDNIHFWHEAKLLREPAMPWEFIQIGNCGSPVEIEEGWILLTHGVGPMRKYCIGALLLDLKDPSKIIGYMPEPILSPNEDEREGYVPNVVYTCGAIVHQEELIIPYAMSDSITGIASVPVKKMLAEMI